MSDVINLALDEAAFLRSIASYFNGPSNHKWAERLTRIANKLDKANAQAPRQITTPISPLPEPEFYTAFAWQNGFIALPGYSNETENGVKDLILQAARKEGYKGTVSGRLLDLGWVIRPVYAQPVTPPVAQAEPIERQYVSPVNTVADLVNNLLILDQALPIYGAQYIDHPRRGRCAIAVDPTVSRERVLDSRWIGQGDALNAAVIWTRASQISPAEPTKDADSRDAERYRFLKSEAYEAVIPFGGKIDGSRTAWITKFHPGADFDEAIDAAIKAKDTP